jgi:RNA polymerase sigma-70 factor, ECF subfamily
MKNEDGAEARAEARAEALAKASQGGDREAFGRLYDLYAKRIYAYLYYRSLKREEAEDLTAAVFLRALENLPGFRPEQGSFSGWIYGIARNALKDHFRSRSRNTQAEATDLWDLPDSFSVELEAENRDLWERLKPHLSALPIDQREILILRTWDELPYKEIAGIVGKSEDACKMTYSRALGILREAMPLSLLIVFLAARPPIS